MHFSFGFSVIVTAFLVSSCAHRSTSVDSANGNGNEQEIQVSGSEETGLPLVQVRDVESFRMSDPEPPAVLSPEFSEIPSEVNEKVEQWVRYFQGPRGRPHMERYLARMTRYSTLMKRILRRNGLPEDLIYIALIESGFSHKATSHAAAVGYWQFIRGTGKRYGLEINTLVDERRDPVLSTQAAAEYYKMLYGEFNSWYLSMASYNVGENRVRREIIRNGTRDFWTLAHKRRLPKETINYVPKFLAARMIGNDPAKYGFAEIDYEPPIEFELIRFDKHVNLKKLAEKLNLDYDDFKLLNPKFRGEIAPAKSNGVLELKVPIGMSQVALQVIPEAAVETVEYIADTGDTDIYRVRRGDSLYTIARRHRTTVGWLKDVNDLKPGRKLRIGQRMIVPVGKQPAAKAQAKRVKPVESAPQETTQAKANVAVTSSEVVKGNAVYYIVQPGDTLSEIAEDYDSTVRELRKMNKLSKRLVLRPGMRLKVPKDEGLPADPTDDPKKQDELQKVEGDPSDGAVPASTRKTNRNSQVAKAKRPTEKVGRKVASKTKPPVRAKNFKMAQQKLEKRIHRVRKGENLYQIAQKYRVSYSDLITVNRKLKNGPLYVGAAVVIPKPEVR